jgi:hypothetical protein
MINPPKKIDWGPPKLRAWLDALLAFTTATRPLPSDSCDISESAHGSRIELSAVISDAIAAETPRPLALSVEIDPNAPPVPPVYKIRVRPSTIAGGSSTDIGFSEGDDPPYLLTPQVGVVQGGITIDGDGNVTSRWIEIVGSITADSDDTFYIEIGTVGQDGTDWITSNSLFGPISAKICRNWFASEAPYYGVTLEGV